MKSSEFSSVIISVIMFAFIFSLKPIINIQFEKIAMNFVFSIIIISLWVVSKKIAASSLDADVEHELWEVSYLGFKKESKLKKPLPAGIILPLIFSLITLGLVKFSAFLTYEARALKSRASKRFGFYSYKEITDWHNGLIGAAGIFSLLILAVITYSLPFSNLESLSKMAVYFAFWNILPLSKLDGTQIFFSSRILWAVLAATASCMAFLAIAVIP